MVRKHHWPSTSRRFAWYDDPISRWVRNILTSDYSANTTSGPLHWCGGISWQSVFIRLYRKATHLFVVAATAQALVGNEDH